MNFDQRTWQTIVFLLRNEVRNHLFAKVTLSATFRRCARNHQPRSLLSPFKSDWMMKLYQIRALGVSQFALSPYLSFLSVPHAQFTPRFPNHGHQAHLLFQCGLRKAYHDDYRQSTDHFLAKFPLLAIDLSNSDANACHPWLLQKLTQIC